MPVINQTMCRRLAVAALAILSCAASAQTAQTKWYRFDHGRRVVGIIQPDPDGAGPNRYAAIRNSFDSRGVLTRVEIGELATWQSEAVAPANWTGFTSFRQTDFTYDVAGRIISEQASAGGVIYALTQYSYDSVGRLDCTARRMNAGAFAAAMNLTACQLGVQGPDGPDRIERKTYDSSDRLLTVTNAYGTSLAQAYTTNTYSGAYQETSKDANGNLTRYAVDGFGRVEYQYFPSKTTAGQSSTTDFERYGYDENGNRTLLKKRDNSQIIYTYDDLNRVIAKDLPGTALDTAMTYDLRNLRLTSNFTASGAGITNEYDGFARLWRSTTNMGGYSRTLTYGHDANGNRIRITHPDGAYFTYAFDGMNRLYRVCENEADCEASTSPAVSLSYDAQGRRAAMTRGTSVSSTGYGYDGISRISSVSQDLDGSATGNDVTQSFTFNAVGQGLTRTITNTAYAYNPEPMSRSYIPNGLNQYTQVNSPGAVSLGYDANGNLTSDGATTFGYDAENRLTSASGAQTATLSYDPNGRLSQVSGSLTTQFLHDGSSLVGEFAPDGTLQRRYVHIGINEPVLWYEGTGVGSANRRYFHANHQGTVMAVASATGSTLEKDTYDVYGVPGGLNTSRFQYTGQAYVPELRLYYYKARFYNPVLGRFMQVDPIGYKDDLNLYSYVMSDPLNATDPDGREIRLQSQSVLPFHLGPNHAKITIIPANQEKYKDDPRFQNFTPDNRRFATLGAGPSLRMYLVSAPNRINNDVNAVLDNDHTSDDQLQIPGGDEDAMIAKLFALDENYNDRLLYSFFPQKKDAGYNSNGYASGLLRAAGFTDYPTPPSAPGFEKPLPGWVFKRATVTIEECDLVRTCSK